MADVRPRAAIDRLRTRRLPGARSVELGRDSPSPGHERQLECRAPPGGRRPRRLVRAKCRATSSTITSPARAPSARRPRPSSAMRRRATCCSLGRKKGPRRWRPDATRRIGVARSEALPGPALVRLTRFLSCHTAYAISVSSRSTRIVTRARGPGAWSVVIAPVQARARTPARAVAGGAARTVIAKMATNRVLRHDRAVRRALSSLCGGIRSIRASRADA